MDNELPRRMRNEELPANAELNPQSAIRNPQSADIQQPPVIVAFCCHYCAYAAADLAGTMRLQYPGSVRVLRLPCTGKIEVNYLLAAFEGREQVVDFNLARAGQAQYAHGTWILEPHGPGQVRGGVGAVVATECNDDRCILHDPSLVLVGAERSRTHGWRIGSDMPARRRHSDLFEILGFHGFLC